MKRSQTVLEEITECRLRSLDRYPGATAALVTAAVLIGAYGSGDALDNWSRKLEPAVGTMHDHIALVAAATLMICALYLPLLIAWSKAVWQNIACSALGPVFIAIIVAILFAFVPLGDEGFLILGIPLWALIYWLRHEPIAPAKTATDSLHRKYFVERLAQILREEPPTVSRIAIMGPWGSGKTVALDLLEEHLMDNSEIPFRIARVNPWRCRTPEDAWTILATGIDAALGQSSLIPQKWFDRPVLNWIAGLIPGKGVGRDLLSFFSGDTKGRRTEEVIEIINRRIEAALNPSNARLLILVDDMERTDSAVLRSLFPVIDRLGELKNCYFVFGIDPDRVSDAFSEKGQSGTLTKGYLDKAFELQIPLPEPRSADVVDLVELKVDREKLPKLAAAMPSLREYIPANPRMALRFLSAARSKELMFLHRFDTKEIPVVPFFIFWICEMEFPGFSDAILEAGTLKIFDEVALTPLMSFDKEKPWEHKDFQKLREQLEAAMNLPKDDLVKKSRLEILVGAIALHAGNSLDWATNSSSEFSLRWLASGHTRLEQLALLELNTLQEFWVGRAGSESIGQMIAECLPKSQFCDPKICALQFVDWEIDQIISATKRAIPADPGSDLLNSVTQHVNGLIAQLRFSQKEEGNTDHQCFGGDQFYRWFEYFTDVSQTSLADLNPALQIARTEFHVALADLLPIQDAFAAVSWRIGMEIERRAGESNAELVAHCAKIKNVLRRKNAARIQAMFRDGTVANDWPPEEFARDDGWRFFYLPQNWLFGGPEEWDDQLSDLLNGLVENKRIAEACAKIASSLFLHPASCDICSGNHESERRFIQQLASDHPNYLLFFWNAAMSLEKANELRMKLLRDRRIAEGKKFISLKILDECFPLPDPKMEIVPS